MPDRVYDEFSDLYGDGLRVIGNIGEICLCIDDNDKKLLLKAQEKKLFKVRDDEEEPDKGCACRYKRVSLSNVQLDMNIFYHTGDVPTIYIVAHGGDMNMYSVWDKEDVCDHDDMLLDDPDLRPMVEDSRQQSIAEWIKR